LRNKLFLTKFERIVGFICDCCREGATTTSSIPKVIVRAGQTLNGILRTLNADYAKIQEGLLSVLYQVLTGKSFELMLAVATVEGELKTFVTKLIKFNECSKQINEPVPDKTAATRAMLFDVSFLMLCSIVQTYGSDVSLAFRISFTERDFVILYRLRKLVFRLSWRKAEIHSSSNGCANACRNGTS